MGFSTMRALWIRWILVLAATIGGMGSAPVAHAAHTSVICAPKSGTVAQAGTVSIDVTDCATNIGFAGIGAVDDVRAAVDRTAVRSGRRLRGGGGRIGVIRRASHGAMMP